MKHCTAIPKDRKITYATFVCDHQPLKPEPNRTRLVVGGDQLEYTDDVGSPAASMSETKFQPQISANKVYNI